MTDTKEIRLKLKEKFNYNSRQVSVSSDYSKITFTIRDTNVNYQELNKFAHTYEHIDRCKASGEILSGGNTYVGINVIDSVKNNWAEKYMQELKKTIPQLYGNTGKKIGNFVLFLHNDWLIKIRNNIKDSWMNCTYHKQDLKKIAFDMYIQDQALITDETQTNAA